MSRSLRRILSTGIAAAHFDDISEGTTGAYTDENENRDLSSEGNLRGKRCQVSCVSDMAVMELKARIGIFKKHTNLSRLRAKACDWAR
jgi:hypothetical protein